MSSQSIYLSGHTLQAYLLIAELRPHTSQRVLQQISLVISLGLVFDNGTGPSGESDSQAGSCQDSWHINGCVEERA